MALSTQDSQQVVTLISNGVQKAKDSLQCLVYLDPTEMLANITIIRNDLCFVVDQTEKTIIALENNSHSINTDLLNLNQQIVSHNNSKMLSESKLQEQNAELQKCQTTLNSLDNEIAVLNQQIEHLQDRIRSEKITRLLWFLNPIGAVLSHLNQAEERYKDRKQDKVNEHTKAQSALSTARNCLNETQTALLSTEETIKDLKQKIIKRENEMKEMGRRLTQLRNTTLELRKMLIGQRLLGEDINFIELLVDNGEHICLAQELIQDLNRAQNFIA